ncbi:MAG: methyltransferase domain-containing protein [Armatimonadota bacterium]|nr:MAG: methyltransferase domain-containing protein [Armatimonadota bacterium]
MRSDLQTTIANWRPDSDGDVGQQIDALLEQLLAAGLLRASACAVLLGEQYHLGGVEDTRRMAELVGVNGADRVVDLACYIGGPARHLAREYGCQVVGVDIFEDCIAIAEKLTELCGLTDRVRFICATADAVPEPDGSFTVAWSQGSFPSDLSWLTEMHRLLVPGGRIAFTGVIRRSESSDPSHCSLHEVQRRVTEAGFRVISAEDISDWELEHGWLPIRRKLEENEAHYRNLLGDEWVKKVYQSIDEDVAAWREGRLGSGRVVAVKE